MGPMIHQRMWYCLSMGIVYDTITRQKYVELHFGSPMIDEIRLLSLTLTTRALVSLSKIVFAISHF